MCVRLALLALLTGAALSPGGANAQTAAPAAEAPALDTVVLDNGDVLTGTIRSHDRERLVLDHPLLGVVELPSARVTSPSLEEPEPAPVAGEEESEEPPPGLLGTGWLAGWERSIGLGVAGTTGNSDTLSLNGELDTSFEDEQKRWGFGSAYLLATEDGSTTKNQAFGQLDRDWLFSAVRWFAFGRGRWDFDEFKDFDHRLSLSAGPGYRFLDDERFRLEGRLAPAVNRTFGGTDDGFTFEGLVGLDFRWRIDEDQSFSTSNTIYPSFTDPGEYRTLSSADYKLKLTDWGLNLKLGLLNEYISDAEDEKNDLTYTGNLVYDF